MCPKWSKDGKSLAFVYKEETPGTGESNLWIIDLDTKQYNQFKDLPISGDSQYIEWSKANEIVFHRHHHYQYSRINIDSGKETELIKDAEKKGWGFKPVFNRDGSKCVISWNRRDKKKRGLWLLDFNKKTEKILIDSAHASSIGWSKDEKSFYFKDYGEKTVEIKKINLKNKTIEDIMQLHTIFYNCGISISNDEKFFTITTYNGMADIWLSSNF